jgi:AcrR family transcriptional regulator
VPRTVKEGDVRRQELIDIGERLFIKNGYDDTTVSDIVSAAGIAQGTFYHHFKSKEALLEAIADRYIDDMNEILEVLVDDESMSAVEKFLALLSRINEFSGSRESMVLLLHEERNVLLHHKLETRMTVIWAPLIRAIIIQGIQEGAFHTKYPDETASALIALLGSFSHTGTATAHRQLSKRKIAAFFDTTERILGARSGILTETIEKMG